MSSKQTSEVIKLNEFDPSKLDTKGIDKSAKYTSQRQNKAFISYNQGDKSSQLKWATKKFEIVSFGVPRDKKDAVKKEGEEMNSNVLRIPEDTKQQALQELFEFHRQLDKWMVDNKEKIVGKENANRYEFMPAIREPADPLAGNDTVPKQPGQVGQSELPRYNSVKYDFDTEFGTNTFKTTFRKMENGSSVPFLVASTDELRNNIPFKSVVRLVASLNKVWISKSPNAATRKYQYGYKVKINLLEVLETPVRTNQVNYTAFSFDDDNETPQNSAVAEAPVPTTATVAPVAPVAKTPKPKASAAPAPPVVQQQTKSSKSKAPSVTHTSSGEDEDADDADNADGDDDDADDTQDDADASSDKPPTPPPVPTPAKGKKQGSASSKRA